MNTSEKLVKCRLFHFSLGFAAVMKLLWSCW